MDGRIQIDELCERTGAKRRTVHFYVQQKLLPPPSGRGMGGFYTEEHVALLSEILRLRKEGYGLPTIASALRRLNTAPPAKKITGRARAMTRPLPSTAIAESVVRHRLAKGVELLVDADLDEETAAKIRTLVSHAHRLLAEEEKK